MARRKRTSKQQQKTSLLTHVRDQVDPEWEERKCEDKGCSLMLDGLKGAWLLVRIDRSSEGNERQGKICDFMFMNDQNSIAAIELKSGTIDSLSETLQQLRGGTAQITAWLSGYGGTVHFRPILVCGKKISKHERVRLREKTANRIRFQKKQYQVKVVDCGTRLSAAV